MTQTGRIFIAARQRKDLSQGDLAKALGYTTPQFVSNIERGISLLPADSVGVVSKILGVSAKLLIWAWRKDHLASQKNKILKYKQKAMRRAGA